jgi:hypothetical protein
MRTAEDIASFILKKVTPSKAKAIAEELSNLVRLEGPVTSIH